MGVTGLWPILAPSARPTPLPSLNRKRLAVDASIWIYQFLKAVRDKEGNALRNSHVVGFFRRICKLLYFGIKPVFVFDGGAPILKRETIRGRKARREGRREDAVRTAGRLLAAQMRRRGEEEEASRKRRKEREDQGYKPTDDADEEVLTGDGANNLVYVGELGMSAQERTQTRKFQKTDQYHLPELTNGVEGMGQPNDPRIMSAEELEEYARQFNDGEDVNLYDFSKIDFNGDFFLSLPPTDRYNILNAARLRSRLRMGLSKEQLEDMFPDRMAFSRFQIDRVRERNELTQRLMNLNGMNDMAGVGVGRIAGERGREYVLVKNDGVEGGYALGVVSTEKGVGEREKPIDVDAMHQKPELDDESEEEFEDVPVEGLNRLPKATGRAQNLSYGDFQAQELASQRKKVYASRRAETSKRRAEQAESLFVDDEAGLSTSNGFDDDEDELNRAIALSLQPDKPKEACSEADEEAHLSRAIALSLQQNHHHPSSGEDELFEDVPMPAYEQRAVETARPIKGASSGSMIAHIVNNRANASVPKLRPQPRAQSLGSDSDSELDLQSALKKARKEKAPEKRRVPAPVTRNIKNPFDGPLPFESLGKSIFGNNGKGNAAENVTSSDFEGDNDADDLSGGFDNSLEENAPKPLPPWLAAGGDIRSDFEEQRRRDTELNAEDKQRQDEEDMEYRKKHAPILIDSSDDESDLEIIDAPSPKISADVAGEPVPEDQAIVVADEPSHKPTEPFDAVAENIRAVPPVSDMPHDPTPAVDPEARKNEIQAYQDTELDEEVDWSESDYGDAVVSGHKITSRHPLVAELDTAIEKSPSPTFEDVEMPNANYLQQSPKPAIPGLELQGVDMPSSIALPTAYRDASELEADAAFNAQPAEDYQDYGDFSDDDEELIAQLAEEASSHAQFAATLNNKTEKQNQDDYERELKQLRNQQKKDRRDADEVTTIMIQECQALLRLFGLPYITAPMEAEAQCAELVRLSLVDGVVTDDCDVFLFGGTRVYKNMFNSNKFVECYLASDIEKELSLNREQMIAIAHLLGSDYTEGLPGVGPVTALEILSEFPSPTTGLQEFRDWWTSIGLSSAPISKEASTFRKKFRRSQQAKLFLAPGFPSSAVTEAYLKPVVDKTPEQFQWGVPDLQRLRAFLMATIGWTEERTDEVLVPVIRDMNRRELEGTQSNITRYFDGAVGTGTVSETVKRTTGSKRMQDAVGKLKAKKKAGALDRTFADEAKDWAKKNKHQLGSTTEEMAEHDRKKKQKKGRGRKRAATSEPEAVGDTPEADVDGEDAEADDGNEAEYGVAVETAKTKAKSKLKEKVPAKRKRTKA